MKPAWITWIARAIVAAVIVFTPVALADPLSCSLVHYRSAPGLVATVSNNTLTITWDGDNNEELRLRLTINSATPTIEELAVRSKGAAWITVASNAVADFRVVSGLRRITNQQLDPLAGLGVKITQEIIDRYKWDSFWDAPLNVPGGDAAHGNNTPPQKGVLNQPGLPRKPDEIKRATAIYEARSCEVKTDGARLEISFPGVRLGVFAGRLQYTVYKGANLIRQEVIAKTDEPSVAYKYEAGIKGLSIGPASRIRWRDVRNDWQESRLEGDVHREPVVVKSGNRLAGAEVKGAAIAAFPPPHNFFWARETAYNLGYNWYRKDTASQFSFGVRQADSEERPSWRQNFALRSARPGTWQRMPVYFYVGARPGEATLESALAFTRGDRFKRLPGYQVMATHFHMAMLSQAMRMGRLDAPVPDLRVLEAAGVSIVAPIDGVSYYAWTAAPDEARWTQWSDARSIPSPFGGGQMDLYRRLAEYYVAARMQSNKKLVVMPNTELIRGTVPRALGGHVDVLVSQPAFWSEGRKASQPLVENHSVYGRVYHVGGAADMMEMARRENMLLFMPHPRSKGSTGFPEAIKDTPHFLDANYRGIGFRWGMGLDGSEQRLSEYRCLPLLDEMNNWVADKSTPPKYLLATSEIYQQTHGDDIYANNPVNYVKLDSLPQPGEWRPIVEAIRKGDYFVTSGEVLIPYFAVLGKGADRQIAAEVEWTFPLEFIEIVWGDGKEVIRQIVSATDLPALGRRRFQIPFQAEGKKWVRFTAWDSAGNGALVQPVKLAPTTAP